MKMTKEVLLEENNRQHSNGLKVGSKEHAEAVRDGLMANDYECRIVESGFGWFNCLPEGEFAQDEPKEFLI